MSRKVAWITSINTQEKSWGSEKAWTCPGHIHNKILKMKEWWWKGISPAKAVSKEKRLIRQA